MKRPSSPAQLALIDLPQPSHDAHHGRARAPRNGRRASSWAQVQAAHNARSSEELLARLASAAATTASSSAERPHAADRPHPAEAEPHMAIDWRAEALADLFDAVERASRAAESGNTVRRAAG